MDLSLLLPERSIEDVLAERVRLVIGGEEYALPALSIEKNEVWLASLERELTGTLDALNDAGDDAGSIVRALQNDTGSLFALVESYDTEGLLPSRAVLAQVLTPLGLIKMVMQIWRAANPKADIAIAILATTAEATSSRSRRRTTSRRPSTAGPRPISAVS